jgi:hypothetical protein
MITNCSITLYNKYTDKTTLKEAYKRTVIEKASWQGQQDKIVSSNVLQSADSVSIRIPFVNEFENKAYIEPKAWLKLVDSERDKYFTFQSTDRIVKGECDFIQSSTNPITNLTANYDNVVSVMSIKVNDYGSKALNHYHLGGR